MTRPRMLFGIKVGDVKESELNSVSEDIIEALEDAGVKEDDWDWILWLHKRTIYGLILGTIETKAALAGEDWLKISSPMVNAERVANQRNVWVFPMTSKKRGPAQDQAEAILAEWQASQWADVEVTERALASSAHLQSPVPITRPGSRPKKRDQDKASGGKAKRSKATDDKPQQKVEPTAEVKQQKPLADNEPESKKADVKPIKNRSVRQNEATASKLETRDWILDQFSTALNGMSDSNGESFAVSKGD